MIPSTLVSAPMFPQKRKYFTTLLLSLLQTHTKDFCAFCILWATPRFSSKQTRVKLGVHLSIFTCGEATQVIGS